jgi:hypothetical protein
MGAPTSEVGYTKDSKCINVSRWLNRNRKWREQWNKNPKLHIGTWNIKTLLKPGRIQELAAELAKILLELVAIQEIRWSGNRVIREKDFSLYYSGTKEQLGQGDIGFILM